MLGPSVDNVQQQTQSIYTGQYSSVGSKGNIYKLQIKLNFHIDKLINK